MVKVLVFPCGSEIGLEIQRSLEFAKGVEIWGASSTSDHGEYAFANYVGGIPFVDDPGFFAAINALVDELEIDFVFPAHDSVVLALAQRRNELHATLLTSDAITCEVARSKSRTYATLADHVRTPEVLGAGRVIDYPVFLKPDVGQGSKGTVRADSASALTRALDENPSLLVLEYLPGEEFTVDCFTEADGSLLYAQARTRTRTSNGISVRSRSVALPEAVDMAERINHALSFRGAWFFQVKYAATGDLALLEVAPRIAGTMSVSRMLGANLPLLTLLDAQGLPVSISVGNYTVEVDRALTSRYRVGFSFNTVYVDFDDTLILGDTVNSRLLGALYRVANEGKRLVLITRHASDVEATLRARRIDPALFDEIVHLTMGEPKSSVVLPDSLFVDDSYRERREVFENSGIPALDVGEAIETLS